MLNFVKGIRFKSNFKFQLNFKIRNKRNRYFYSFLAQKVCLCVCVFLLACMNVWLCFGLFYNDCTHKTRCATELSMTAEWKQLCCRRVNVCQTELNEALNIREQKIRPERQRSFSTQTTKWHLAEWAKEASSLRFNKTPFLLQERGQRLVC